MSITLNGKRRSERDQTVLAGSSPSIELVGFEAHDAADRALAITKEDLVIHMSITLNWRATKRA